jgi:hypothetical protein
MVPVLAAILSTLLTFVDHSSLQSGFGVGIGVVVGVGVIVGVRVGVGVGVRVGVGVIVGVGVGVGVGRMPPSISTIPPLVPPT